MSNFLKFFASARGRKFMFFTTATASLTTAALVYVPNTFLSRKHREFVALYSEGAERPVPANIMKRYEIALDYIKISDFERALMKPFMVAGFDLYHIGSVNYRFGGLTGIPINYTYTSPEDINKSEIMIRGKPVDWNSHGGKLLEQALVLKESEQIFGIARELQQLRTYEVLFNSLFPSLGIILHYVVTANINNKLRLFYRPLSLRLIMYALVGCYCYGVYAFTTDYTQVKYDGGTDEELASYGPGFLEAGLGFYDKQLKKNMAIRELTGDNSEYTALGNENFILRNKRLPLTIRKVYFETLLEEHNKKGLKDEEGESDKVEESEAEVKPTV